MNFISDIPFFYIIPIAIAAAGLTWFFYTKNKSLDSLSKLQKNAVSMLRFCALLFIGILLLGLLLEFKKTRDEKPLVIAVYDTSSSLLNYKDSARVKKEISQFQKALELKHGEKFDVLSYEISESFNPLKKLHFSGQKSNLSLAFEEIFTNYYNRNIGAIVCISDGNFNEGPNPLYAAQKIPLTPVFSIGVGDTTTKKDHLIRDVISNEIAFYKNKFPVEVDLEAYKIGKKTVTVSIQQNGKTLIQKKVNYANPAEEHQQLFFELEANQVGFQQYTVVLQSVDGEYTTTNNRRSFYVEVLDARNRIVLLCGAPHPDISALKSVLEQDENIEVITSPIEKWDQNTKNTDLVIWHEPGVNFNEGALQRLQQSKTPIWFFVGVNTSNAIAQRLGIGLAFSGSSQQDEVQAVIKSGFEKFEISDNTQSELAKFPPVTVRFGTPKIGAGSEVLLNQKVGTVSNGEPLLYFGSLNKQKFGVFLGDGIWKWKLADYLKHKNNDIFNELIHKSSQYLVKKENASNLRVSLPKRFLYNEPIQIKAEFYNDNLELITKPSIQFNVIDQDGKKSNLRFGVNGSIYLLALGKLKPGTYSWTASTSFDGKKHVKKGNFVVEKTAIEQLETQANHGVLKQLSNETQGKFYTLSKADQAVNDLMKRPEITTISYEESSFDSLLDFIWILLLIAACLTAEWFIKRVNGLY